MPERLIVHCDHRGVWRVQPQGDECPLSEHGSETEAEWAAVRHAAAAGAQEIVMFDLYHRVHVWRVPDAGGDP